LAPTFKESAIFSTSQTPNKTTPTRRPHRYCSIVMADMHTSFLQLYDALPDELKLKILGYALRQDSPVDRMTAAGPTRLDSLLPSLTSESTHVATGLLGGRVQPLFSPEFRDAGEFSVYSLRTASDIVTLQISQRKPSTEATPFSV
jgi:hypothetical protein